MDAAHALTVAVASAAGRAFLEHTSDLIFVKDRRSVYVSASQTFVRMTGQPSLDCIIGRTDFEIFENRELARRYTEDDRKLLEGGRDLVDYIEPLTDDRGQSRYSLTSKYILRGDDGEAIGILGISRDITKEYLTQQRHRQEAKYLFELPANTYATLFMDIDAWRIIRHRRQEEGEHILPPRETMEDFIANALLCLADPGDTEARRFYQNLTRSSMLELCRSGVRSHTLKYLRKMPSGSEIWVQTDINFLADPETGHLCAIWSLKNINSAVQDEINLRHAAEQDEMTGLMNRAGTVKAIRQTLSDEPEALHALFAIDVDHFKALNDTLGHQAGDAFLVSFSQALKSCFRDSDIVGRMGGDEFFVLMKNVHSEPIIAEKVETLLRISRLLCGAYPVDGLAVSIGVSRFPADGITLEALYAKADAALYQSKRSGRNRATLTADPL